MKFDDEQQQQPQKNLDSLKSNAGTRAVAGCTTSTITKRKSSTTLMCELTRLKSQQKYLECNQVKLIPEHFCDTDADTGSNSTNNNKQPAVIKLINEIEHLKTQLDSELTVFRHDSRTAVKDMCLQIKQVKEDTQQPDRLQHYTIGALREHIIGINTQIERLNMKNSAEMQLLQKECENLENDTKILIK